MPNKSINATNYDAIARHLDLLLDAICVVDKDGVFLFVSGACERIFGYTQAEMLGRPMIELVHPEDRAITLQTVDRIEAGQPQPHFENRYIRKDGRVAHIMWSARRSEADQCRVAVARDITQRKQAEARQQAVYAISEASHSAENMRGLFEKVHQIIDRLLPAKNIAIALHDPQSRVISFPYVVADRAPEGSKHRHQAESLCTQIIGTGQAIRMEPGQPAGAGHDTTAPGWLGVPLRTRKDTLGALILHHDSADAGYTASDQELLQFVSTQIAAAVERKHLMAHLQRAALYDPLTQLPNRALLYDRIDSALIRAERNDEQLSLIFLDLDKFKEINDTYGHSAGDRLLEQVARRIEACVRKSDTVSRLGGDEFVILVEGIGDSAQAEQLAGKIRQALCCAFELPDGTVSMEPSLGLAHYPEHGCNKIALLNYADKAMYADKGLRRAKDQIE